MADVLLLGPHGVTGRAIAERLDRDDAWRLTTASRRPRDGDHLAVDLLDAGATREALARRRAVTHVVYAAYVERSSSAMTGHDNIAMLRHVLDGLASAGAELQRVVLIGGGKSYGEHLGPYPTPAREDDPRIAAPVFYYGQEDLLAARAAEDGFRWTVLRPDVVIGRSEASPMNLLTALGAFAALSKEARAPLRFPGQPGAWTALHQVTDADLLAEAVAWALESAEAADEAFNVTDGEPFRWQHVWGALADAMDMPAGPPLPMTLARELDGMDDAWDAIVRRHGLGAPRLADMAPWAFADGVWGLDYDLVQSTLKIRRAGFTRVADPHETLVNGLAGLRQAGWLP